MKIVSFPTNVSPKDPKSALLDLEPAICDLRRMSEITASLVMEAGTGPENEDSQGRAVFAATLMERLVTEFNELYYRLLGE
ncbi:hypothetical protein [Bradyrhizobium sp. STM 3557]|uniref:hypothetical protein n=1 Tax=Bradyrhizobium sp. STM 3557 TaxID=578920 RepID=UPI00388D0893